MPASAAGSGGTNAHVVIEEYAAPQRNAPNIASAGRPALVVLSARYEDGLRARAQQLVAAIDRCGFEDRDLSAIAYTLQVGREAMEYRLAIIAGSITTLQAKLRDYLAGNSPIEDLYQDRVKRSRDSLAVVFEDGELQDIVAMWMARRKYGKLLALWVKGLSFDWRALYETEKPALIGLPTYPFAGDRYWLPKSQEAGQEIGVPRLSRTTGKPGCPDPGVGGDCRSRGQQLAVANGSCRGDWRHARTPCDRAWILSRRKTIGDFA